MNCNSKIALWIAIFCISFAGLAQAMPVPAERLSRLEIPAQKIAQIDGFTILGLEVYNNDQSIGYGYFGQNGNKQAAIVRFNADGTLDTSFGLNGLVIFSNSQNNQINNQVSEVKVNPDGTLSVYIKRSMRPRIVDAKGIVY